MGGGSQRHHRARKITRRHRRSRAATEGHGASWRRPRLHPGRGRDRARCRRRQPARKQHQRRRRICHVRSDASAQASATGGRTCAWRRLGDCPRGGGQPDRVECVDARHTRRRYDRAPHRRHRARWFWHDRPWHLPPQGIAARRRSRGHACRPVRAKRCRGGLLRADR